MAPTKDTEYIKVKVFLYKYSPVFTPVPSGTNKDSKTLADIRQKIKDAQNALKKDQNDLTHLEIYGPVTPTVVQLQQEWNKLNPTAPILNTSFDDFPKYKTEHPKGAQIFTKLFSIAIDVKEKKNVLGENWNNILMWYITNKSTDKEALQALIDDIIKLRNIEGISNLRVVMFNVTQSFLRINVLKNVNVTKVTKQRDELTVDIAKLKKEIAYWQTQEQEFITGLANVQRFSIELDEKYFSKVEISDFVIDYRLSYGLHNQFDWNINFYNGTLDLSYMGVDQKNKYFLKTGEGLIQPSTNTYSNLADYEVEDDNFDGNYKNYVATTKRAMDTRTNLITIGVTQQASASEKITDINERKPQILLSDLIQKFDFISCYIYKSKDPLDDDLLNFDSVAPTFKKEGLEIEAWLEQIGFSNEFNGFVTGKTVTRQTGSLNTLSINGAGSFCLFDRTKVLYSPTLFTSTLYDQAELFNTQQLTVFSSLFSDKSIPDIVDIMLRDIYGIVSTKQDPTLKVGIITDASRKDLTDFISKQIIFLQNQMNQATKVEQAKALGLTEKKYAQSSQQYAQQIKNLMTRYQSDSTFKQKYGINFSILDQKAFTDFENELSRIKITYFLDLARLKIETAININIFTIAPYLYALVMKQRGCNFRDITSLKLAEAKSALEGSKYLGTAFKMYMGGQGFSSNEVDLSKSKYSPVLMEANVGDLTPYFRFLQNGFSNFNPTLKTPNQILDEVKEASFIEIYEVAGGTLIVRLPKYNDTSTLLLSSNYNVIATSYSDQIKGVVSKEKLTYHPDLIKDLPFNIFAFTNGKLLLQYGLTETEASANPNVKYTKAADTEEVEVKKKLGIFNYARFFLELNNAAQKTSSITLEYVPATTIIKDSTTGEEYMQAFGIGNLFFDEVNSKVSYITNITKTCRIGGELSMVMTGTFVRDGFIYETMGLPLVSGGKIIETGLIKQLVFRQLPELIKLNKLFATSDKKTTLDQEEERKYVATSTTPPITGVLLPPMTYFTEEQH